MEIRGLCLPCGKLACWYDDDDILKYLLNERQCILSQTTTFAAGKIRVSSFSTLIQAVNFCMIISPFHAKQKLHHTHVFSQARRTDSLNASMRNQISVQ